MPTLHIEHPITDSGVWSPAFGRFAEARRQAGVRAQGVQCPAGEPKTIILKAAQAAAGGTGSGQEGEGDG